MIFPFLLASAASGLCVLVTATVFWVAASSWPSPVDAGLAFLAGVLVMLPASMILVRTRGAPR